MRAEFTPLRNSDPPAEDNTDVSSGGGSNHATTTIIVVVVGVVGCLIIIFLLYRVLRRSWTPKSAPLPPVQPIAHHREQQLAELADRTNRLSVRNELSYSSTPLGLSPSGSDASLLKALEGDGYASHRGSFYALDNQRDTYDALNGDDGLRLPIPAFGDSRRTSVSSLKSIDSATHPLPPTPVSVAPPSPSQSTFGRPIPRSRPVSQGRPRPTSTVSMASVRSTRSGVPHGPHSQVKIVLPTPLAPALQPHMTPPSADARLSGVENWEGSARTSMVDVWTPALHRSASSYNISKPVTSVIMLGLHVGLFSANPLQQTLTKSETPLDVAVTLPEELSPPSFLFHYTTILIYFISHWDSTCSVDTLLVRTRSAHLCHTSHFVP
ncbi:hypothetical protein BV22DRAFT_826259 [Leucogyrophana mollusca]|uniref:Uncharacterized protein n=1 Tax=Leucogyrophana mollusca TaxID=85980 RepID=A0ACB8B4I1_9AGAM|nr:hypothetical protein BV22DRAFT_826259 [Leucogyrophana mollusca]